MEQAVTNDSLVIELPAQKARRIFRAYLAIVRSERLAVACAIESVLQARMYRDSELTDAIISELRSISRHETRSFSIESIASVVCDVINNSTYRSFLGERDREIVTPENYNIKTRKSEYVEVRRLVSVLYRALNHTSIEKVGDAVGIDHATVLHHKKRVAEYCMERDYAETVGKILEGLELNFVEMDKVVDFIFDRSAMPLFCGWWFL